MNKKYDCTKDVMKHKHEVYDLMKTLSMLLKIRGSIHDDSKLQEPEKSMFDEWTPKLKELEFGSAEYKEALKNMGIALQHHYENNRHHPEHFDIGISDMNLIDIMEMFCDWSISAKTKGVTIDFNYLQKRFNISDQLRSIFENTVQLMEDNHDL